MSPLLRLTVLTVLVSPVFSQYQVKPFQSQRSCDLRSCQCSQQYIPFCGTDGVTYGNICSLECAQRGCDSSLKVRFEGVCPERYIHDEGTSYKTAESKTNFNVIRPPVNYRPQSPILPATIPTPTTRRTTTSDYFQYGTTQRPTTRYFQYGTTSKPTTNYFQYGTTKRPTTNYFQYETTKRPTTNYYEYRTTQPTTANYFQYGTSRKPTTNFYAYTTTARPYGGQENNYYGGNGRDNYNVYGSSGQNNQNSLSSSGGYGDFYDY